MIKPLIEGSNFEVESVGKIKIELNPTDLNQFMTSSKLGLKVENITKVEVAPES